MRYLNFLKYNYCFATKYKIHIATLYILLNLKQKGRDIWSNTKLADTPNLLLDKNLLEIKGNNALNRSYLKLCCIF